MEKKRKMFSNSRSQLTIFVIIAIAFVVMMGLLIFFMQGKGTGEQKISYEADPVSAIQTCAKNSLDSSQEKISPNGGFLNPRSYVVYDDSNVTWMCHTSQDYELCTNKHPLLIHEMEKELENIVRPEVVNCFSQMKAVYQKYDYKEEPLNLSVEIVDGRVLIKIDKKISYTKSGSTTSLDNFDTAVFSPLYDFAKITQTIIADEIDCNCGEESCNSDSVMLSIYNPDYEIGKFVSGNSEEVYSITELETGSKFNVAIRNCVRTP
jgi:hypothetical protein